MRLSKLAATLLGACIAFTSATVIAETLKLSHVRPQGAVADLDIKTFIEDAQASADSLKFNVYPANALGDYTDVQERVSIGAVDMALQPISSAADRKLQLGLIPYLATDWVTAAEIYGANANIRKEIESLYAKQDIKVLAAYPVYFGGVALNKDPYDDDGKQKTLKLRVPPFKTFSLLAESLGYIPAPIPFAEAFTSVQTDVVDGVIGAGAEGYYDSFRDVTKYYIPMNTHLEIWYLLINQETFNSLSESEQEALSKAAANFEQKRWDTVESEQTRNENRLVEAGATLIEVSDEELAQAAANAREQVWPEIINDMGEEWAKSVLKPLLND